MDTPVINIRIEVDLDTDAEIERWADSERRSKKEHVAYLVQELLNCYRKDPLVLHRMKIASAPRAIPA